MGSHSIQSKPDLHLEKLEGWFQTYWSKLDKNRLNMDELEQLIYPFLRFDHAVAFAYITKRAALEAKGHFEEFNPTGYRGLHLQARVIRTCHGSTFLTENTWAKSYI